MGDNPKSVLSATTQFAGCQGLIPEPPPLKLSKIFVSSHIIGQANWHLNLRPNPNDLKFEDDNW